MTPSVLFDARLVLERPTGIGRYIVSLLPELLAAAPDWTFHVLRRPEPWTGYGRWWEAPNVVLHVSRERHMSLQQQVTLPRIAARLGVDLIHYPHFDAPVLIGRIPVVSTVYDVKYITLSGLFRRFDRIKRWYLRGCLRATARRAAAIITLSRATLDDIKTLLAPRGVLRVVEAAPDRAFRPAPEAVITAFRERYGLQRPYLLCVGEFRPHKNHARLVRAFAASGASAGHDLVLVGQRHAGDAPPESEARAAGVETQVRVITDISAEHLVAAYTGAKAFVLPSLHEGFGLPILEAMACGAPTMTSRTTAAGEVAGDAALLVDPESETEIAAALHRLASDPAEAARLRAAGFVHAQRFSWSAAARGTLSVYNEVLAGGRR